MSKRISPPGWRSGEVERRFASGQPSSYDRKAHTCECIISVGAAVQRSFGTEKLRISQDAVILDRMKSSGIPLLDSHNQHGLENHIGRFTRIWVTPSAVMGQIRFDDTPRGRLAEGMVARGEIKGISAGYIVRDWEITDENGRKLDPEKERVPLDGSTTFTASKWEILEGSLVSVPADDAAMIRSIRSGKPIGSFRATVARMRMRQRMIDAGNPV